MFKGKQVILLRLVVATTFIFALIGCQSDSNPGADSKGANQNTAKRERLVAGAEPPPFELTSLTGEKRRLADFSGQVVLLNLWATWCAPCVAEMPSLQRLYQSLKDEGLQVVAVSVDTERKLEELRTFVERYGLSFSILKDPLFGLPSRYGVTGFPESVFIGRDGRLVAFRDPQTGESSPRVIGDRPWDSEPYKQAVRELLGR